MSFMKLLTSRLRGWVLLPLALQAAPALAHLGYPDTTSVTVRRGHPENLLVGATFGAILSRDGGRSWSWICPEAMGYGGWRPETFLWQQDGTLLAATGADLIRSRDAGCTWESHPFFKSQGLWPVGLASPPSRPSRLWVSTGRESSPNGLYRSDDGGETFTSTSLHSNTPAASDNTVYTSVKVAPSDPRRLYVSGRAATGQRLYRSDDEGVTWTEIPQPFPEYSRAYSLVVLRVSDTDPDRLWARVSSVGWTYLLESRDGGYTFQSILHPEGQFQDGVDEGLMGIEVSPDGKTLWAATPTRLYRVNEGDSTSSRLSLPDGNACVERQGEVLLVCGASRVHGWALASTTDEGGTYTPLLDLPNVRPPGRDICPTGTPTHDVCRINWPRFAPTLKADPTLPWEEGDVIPTPPSEEPPSPKPSGCSATSGRLPAAALLLLASLRRPRRRAPE